MKTLSETVFRNHPVDIFFDHGNAHRTPPGIRRNLLKLLLNLKSISADTESTDLVLKIFK
jgi:hypothetical protein